MISGQRRHTDERHAALQEVTCGRCGAAVLAAKFSPQHTSVQWSGAAMRACEEFAAASEPAALVPTCASLREAIARAVGDGRLEVTPP